MQDFAMWKVGGIAPSWFHIQRAKQTYMGRDGLKKNKCEDIFIFLQFCNQDPTELAGSGSNHWFVQKTANNMASILPARTPMASAGNSNT